MSNGKNLRARTIDVLSSVLLAILMIAAAVVWIFVDAAKTEPKAIHLVVFVAAWIWFGVVFLIDTLLDLLGIKCSEHRSVESFEQKE